MKINLWNPIDFIPNRIVITKMIVEDRVLCIELDDLENENNKIQIEFEAFFGFRFFNESERLASLDIFNKLSKRAVFYYSTGSSFSEWLIEESCNTVSSKNLIHYYIVTDDIIEVLSAYPPEVKFAD